MIIIITLQLSVKNIYSLIRNKTTNTMRTISTLNITYNTSVWSVAMYCARIRGNLSGPHFDLFDKGLVKHIHTLTRSGIPDIWAHAWSAWFGNLACYVLGFGRAEPS